MFFFEAISDFLGLDEEWPVVLFFIGMGLLLFGAFMTIPLISINISFIVFMSLAFISILIAALIDTLSLGLLTGVILELIDNEVVIWVVRIIWIIGLIVSIYHFYTGIRDIEWKEWGIRAFTDSMNHGSSVFAAGKRTLLDSGVFSKIVIVWKAIIKNVGEVDLCIIKNFFFPWSWISLGIGLFKSE